MSIARNVYRVTRSILFSAIGLIAALYLSLYIALSIPSVQNEVRSIAEKELSALFGSQLSIGKVEIFPFNEAVVYEVRLFTPDGQLCASIEKLGAGIDLWHLVSRKKVEITYAELIGLDARIWQDEKDGPLNIQFLIDAFAPKEKNKPPTRFDLALHSIVIRNCKASFDRLWQPRNLAGRIDFNHLFVDDLKADVDIPRLSNDDYVFDLRRLSLSGPEGLSLETLSLSAHITPHSISLKNTVIKFPGSDIRPSDIVLEFPSFSDIPQVLREGSHQFVIVDSHITPSDFAAFLPGLRELRNSYLLSLDLSGNLSSLEINRFSLSSSGYTLSNSFLSPFASGSAVSRVSSSSMLHDGRRVLGLEIEGSVSGLTDFRNSFVSDLTNMRLAVSASEAEAIIHAFADVPEKVSGIIRQAEYLDLTASGKFLASSGYADADVSFSSGLGDIDMKGSASALFSPIKSVSADISSDGIDLGKFLDNPEFGPVVFALSADGRLGRGVVDGDADLTIEEALIKGRKVSDITANISKSGHEVSCDVACDNPDAVIYASARASLDGKDTQFAADIDIPRFIPSAFGLLSSFPGYVGAGRFSCDFTGNDIDNLSGYARGENITFVGDLDRGSLSLNGFVLDVVPMAPAEGEGSASRSIRFNSDFLDATLTGSYTLSSIGREFQCLLSDIIPAFVKCPATVEMASSGRFEVIVKPSDRLYTFLNAPVRPLMPVPFKGSFDMRSLTASLDLDVPYLQQGRDKLVRDTRLDLALTGESGRGAMKLHTVYPSKKGDAELDLELNAVEGDINLDLGWLMSGLNDFHGMLSMELDTGVETFDIRKPVVLRIKPTSFTLSGADWQIGESTVRYADKSVEVDKFRIWHGDQFVLIDGTASSLPEDMVEVRLADIDLGFIFDTLNINYVTFGGIASGEIAATGVFSPEPVAATRWLKVKNLSYHDCVLGDGDISSRWINSEKEVEIKADIRERGHRSASIDGGIWLGQDSLNFKIDADKVNVAFLKPFMAAFTSDVGGRASGKANFFGNFHDIDLTGRIFADSIAMKVDYTNVCYHGSDSVRIDPGHIIIPGFRLYDKYGNSALLSGELHHNYFHDPRFNFRISEAKGLLCYDTNASINPVWYGRVFGNGGGVIRGWPGAVAIDMDMSTAPGSNFTFVISDEQEAGNYDFLSFTDKRKEELMKSMPRDTVPDFLEAFRKKVEASQDRPSTFSMNLFASVTPDALLTIVMDPEAGDKITARGAGPMQMAYDSEKDDITMYGKYTLEEGKYNFTLQELILRDFTIKPGSSISFNGDPMRADLDIKAAYRVNTNLSDLDKSFASDPELNRTNVPVDAILNIDGEMDHPEITFDIELPTLTSDITRKVKSIISTDDLMSRQVIYLLALNRFYTPEYMGGGSNGSGELASVASSTLSSQFSRIVSQLTDKVAIAPSFRSDKGDFSDFEMDLALSSSLLNNRLLINGNFGYRDPSTSSTTFIGDFDIEYLLTRSGNLRLKAYNHFNDQNYYLKSSLTTQGIGVVFRRDFENPFTFLRRRRRVMTDSIPPLPAEQSDSLENQ